MLFRGKFSVVKWSDSKVDDFFGGKNFFSVFWKFIFNFAKNNGRNDKSLTVLSESNSNTSKSCIIKLSEMNWAQIRNHLTIAIDYLVGIECVGKISYIANEPMRYALNRIWSKWTNVTAVFIVQLSHLGISLEIILIIIQSICIICTTLNFTGNLSYSHWFSITFHNGCCNKQHTTRYCRVMCTMCNVHLIYVQFNGKQFQITAMLTALCGDNTPKIYLVW